MVLVWVWLCINLIIKVLLKEKIKPSLSLEAKESWRLVVVVVFAVEIRFEDEKELSC